MVDDPRQRGGPIYGIAIGVVLAAVIWLAFYAVLEFFII